MQYTAIFYNCINGNFLMKIVILFLVFDKTYEVMVHVRTYHLCFGLKIRKQIYPCHPKFDSIKVGCKAVFITRTCYPGVKGTLLVYDMS